MKLQYTLLSAVFALCLLTSCEKDAIEIEVATVDLTTQLNLNAKEQAPSVLFDDAKGGIYHGVVANKNSQERGKIWINLGNNTKYYATIEMVGGKKMFFTSSEKFDTTPSYYFTGKTGDFTLEINDIDTPEIIQMTLKEASYFAFVIKSTSVNRATSYTGTYEVPNGGFSGTWNVLSNGLPSPNGFSGTAISDVVVTLAGGSMFVDNSMEQGVFGCGNTTFWVPIVDVFNVTGDGVLAFGQETLVNGGMTNWSLGYSDFRLFGEPSYVTDSCDTRVVSGSFSWLNPSNYNMIDGNIFIDIAP